MRISVPEQVCKGGGQVLFIYHSKNSAYAVDRHWRFLRLIQTLGFWDNWDIIKMSYTFLKAGRYLANNLTNNIHSDSVMFCEAEIEDIMRVLNSGIDSEL